jgi:hypothetical protein
MEQKRSRGRPKTGPIHVAFVGVNWDARILQKVYSPEGLSRDEIDSLTIEDGKKLFVEATGLQPDEIEGPSYDKKSSKTNKKESETLSNNEVAPAVSALSNSLGEAVYDNWKGMAFSIEGQSDNVFFLPIEDLTKNLNRNKPNAKAIAKTELAFN